MNNTIQPSKLRAATARTLKFNSIVFTVALLLNNGWLALGAVLFWIAALTCLIAANFQEKDLSFVAVFYGILIVLFLRLVVFSLTSA